MSKRESLVESFVRAIPNQPSRTRAYFTERTEASELALKASKTITKFDIAIQHAQNNIYSSIGQPPTSSLKVRGIVSLEELSQNVIEYLQEVSAVCFIAKSEATLGIDGVTPIDEKIIINDGADEGIDHIAINKKDEQIIFSALSESVGNGEAVLDTRTVLSGYLLHLLSEAER